VISVIEGGVLDIYIINLDKDVHRLNWMEQQLAAQKLQHSRIAAVNGYETRQQDLNWSNPLRSNLGAAEIGCLQSHANAWRMIVQSPSEHAVVLEDDVHISDDFGDLIRSISVDPNEFCIHKLETYCANVTLKWRPSYAARNRKAHVLETNHGGTGAYFLNKGTASRLLGYLDLFRGALDTELFDPQRRTIKNLKIYQWVPAPCVQDFLVKKSKYRKGFVSNIGKERADVKCKMLRCETKATAKTKVKALLRPVYTRLYSAFLLQHGRIRAKIKFK
jgi:glycosyl transferase family 25